MYRGTCTAVVASQQQHLRPCSIACASRRSKAPDKWHLDPTSRPTTQDFRSCGMSQVKVNPHLSIIRSTTVLARYSTSTVRSTTVLIYCTVLLYCPSTRPRPCEGAHAACLRFRLSLRNRVLGIGIESWHTRLKRWERADEREATMYSTMNNRECPRVV